MNDTPNTNPNESSELGYNVKFWSGVVVGYEYQQDLKHKFTCYISQFIYRFFHVGNIRKKNHVIK